MTALRRARCFIAMAFERGDTDALYERALRPVLRRNGITPVIINRRQSNQDLNNQIIAELNSCDLCIADLTYARPSVYFEAGYAERGVPVIYTVRADHLRSLEDSERVHFDLQMKPLVTWKTANDPSFRTRLEARLKRTFVTSWNRAQRDLSVRDSQRTAFRQMSVVQRLVSVRYHAMLAVRRYGLRTWSVHLTSTEPSGKLDKMKTASEMLISEAEIGYERRVACVLVGESITTTRLRQLRNDLIWLSLFHSPVASRAGMRRVTIEVLCVSLHSIPAARVEASFESYARGDREGRFVYKFKAAENTGGEVPVEITLDCIGDVRSEVELRAELRSLCASTFGRTPEPGVVAGGALKQFG